jgi:hypothetical protein
MTQENPRMMDEYGRIAGSQCLINPLKLNHNGSRPHDESITVCRLASILLSQVFGTLHGQRRQSWTGEGMRFALPG